MRRGLGPNKKHKICAICGNPVRKIRRTHPRCRRNWGKQKIK